MERSELINVLRREWLKIGKTDQTALQAFHEKIVTTAKQMGQPLPHALRHLRGQTQARLYDFLPDLAALKDACEDLQNANDEANKSNDAWEEQYLKDLIVALSRYGEQTSDIAQMRRVIELSRRFEPFDASTAIIANAKAVASLWLGSVSGDSQIVERACRDLQSLLKDAKLDQEILDQTIQNTSLLLLENARQNRSVRVYTELVGFLSKRKTNAPKFQSTIGSAKLELAQLNGDVTMLDEAIVHFDVALSAKDRHVAHRSQVLHSMAQTHFLRGKLSKDKKDFERAVATLSDAVVLLGQTTKDDARLARMKADLGAYTLALAWTIGDGTMAKSAAAHYEDAREILGSVRAPYLYARISLGLFELHFRMKHWDRAKAVALDILDAFERIQSDPGLTAGINDFGPLALSGFSDKYAACLLFLGDAHEAAFQLDKLRGRRISISRLRHQAPLDDNQELVELKVKLEQAIKEKDDKECRFAWEDYLTKRRELGLDLDDGKLRKNFDAAPSFSGGVFIHLTFSIFGSHALVRHSGQTKSSSITLPDTALTATLKLLQGQDNQLAWQAAYASLLENPDLDSPNFQTWNQNIDHAQNVLGEQIMGPIHQQLLDSGVSPGSTVILSVPGEFAMLPLTSAVISDQQRMEDIWSISVAPCLSTLDQIDDNAGSFVCISPDAETNKEMPELPFAAQEAAALSRSNKDVFVVKGRSATPNKVLEAFRSHDLVHLACHARYGGHNETVLYLDQGELLSLRRLAAAGHQSLNTRLVVLSACEAGLVGLTSDPDEYVGLPGTLLGLGVSGVIAPLWPVHDDAGLVFSDHFYRSLFDGAGNIKLSPARALASSKQFMREVTWGELTQEEYMNSSMYDRSLPAMRRIDKKQSLSRRAEPIEARERPFEHPHHWAGWTMWGH